MKEVLKDNPDDYVCIRFTNGYDTTRKTCTIVKNSNVSLYLNNISNALKNLKVLRSVNRISEREFLYAIEDSAVFVTVDTIKQPEFKLRVYADSRYLKTYSSSSYTAIVRRMECINNSNNLKCKLYITTKTSGNEVLVSDMLTMINNNKQCAFVKPLKPTNGLWIKEFLISCFFGNSLLGAFIFYFDVRRCIKDSKKYNTERALSMLVGAYLCGLIVSYLAWVVICCMFSSIAENGPWLFTLTFLLGASSASAVLFSFFFATVLIGFNAVLTIIVCLPVAVLVFASTTSDLLVRRLIEAEPAYTAAGRSVGSFIDMTLIFIALLTWGIIFLTIIEAYIASRPSKISKYNGRLHLA